MHNRLEAPQQEPLGYRTSRRMPCSDSSSRSRSSRLSPATAMASKCRPARGWSCARANSASARTMSGRRGRRAGRAVLRQHAAILGGGRTGAEGHRPHQCLCHRPRASQALHGRARPAVCRSGAGLDADDRVRLARPEFKVEVEPGGGENGWFRCSGFAALSVSAGHLPARGIGIFPAFLQRGDW